MAACYFQLGNYSIVVCFIFTSMILDHLITVRMSCQAVIIFALRFRIIYRFEENCHVTYGNIVISRSLSITRVPRAPSSKIYPMSACLPTILICFLPTCLLVYPGSLSVCLSQPLCLKHDLCGYRFGHNSQIKVGLYKTK